jgi:glycosyltransferase involved in cell wall biosynthesis
MKVLFITDIPRPYRISLINEISNYNKVDILSVYLGRKIENLDWQTFHIEHNHVFLGESRLSFFKKLGYNKGILKIFKEYSPDFLITGGFRLTILIAVIYAYINKVKHIIYTDAWELQESKYSKLHILVRKIIYRHAKHFFPVSIKGKENINKNYNVSNKKITIIPYTPTIKNFYSRDFKDREYDIMFSGQFIERKQPMFFCRVALLLKEKMRRNIKVLLIGIGPQYDEIVTFLNKNEISFYAPGFLQKNQLQDLYSNSKFFLFPTISDGWGVVAHEAIASGTIVITTPFAGVANELIINNFNGFILPLDESMWVNKILDVLNDKLTFNRLSNNCIKHSLLFNKKDAAENFVNVLMDLF